MVNEKHTAEIIRMIRRLREMEIDGETTEQIVDMLGMKEQLLRQLFMASSPTVVKELMDEWYELQGVPMP